jgi:hypothetical protein
MQRLHISQVSPWGVGITIRFIRVKNNGGWQVTGRGFRKMQCNNYKLTSELILKLIKSK